MIKTQLFSYFAATVITLSSMGGVNPMIVGAATNAAGDDIVTRAKVWVDKRIPYNQVSTRNADGTSTTTTTGYRQDCSGFVSMAWGLPAEGLKVPTTDTLPQYGTEIQPDQLQPGDIYDVYINDGISAGIKDGHTGVFVRWTDKANLVFETYEENGYDGTTTRSRQLTKSNANEYKIQFNIPGSNPVRTHFFRKKGLPISLPDTTPPTGDIVFPATDIVTKNPDLTIKVRAEDPSGIDLVRMYASQPGGSGFGNPFCEQRTPNAEGLYECRIILGSQGVSLITAHAIDKVGNTKVDVRGYGKYLRVTFDSTPPTGNLTSLSDGTTNNPVFKLTANAADVNGSGVKRVYFFATFNGVRQEICYDDTPPYECPEWNSGNIPNQDIQFAIDVFDQAGNFAQNAGGIRTVKLNRSVQPNTNLVKNGTFDAGLTNWGVWNPNGNSISANVADGRLIFKNLPGGSGGAIFQDIGAFPANSPVEINILIANSTEKVRKINISMRNLPAGWSGAVGCDFILPARTPLSQHTIIARVPSYWTNTRLEITPLTTDNASYLQVDDISVAYKPNLSVPSTPCKTASRTDLAVDNPPWSATPINVSGVLNIYGWAVDTAVSGNGPTVNSNTTGVDAIDAWLRNSAGVDKYLGSASYGSVRTDVGAYFGQTRFNNSGWGMNWDTTSVPPGEYELRIHARSIVDQSWKLSTRKIKISRPAPSIILDAGHGGADPGALKSGLIEKDINLDITQKVRNILVAKGYTIKMTRDSDVAVDLGARGILCNSSYAGFISIHANSGGGTGSEAFYANNALVAKNTALATNLTKSVATKIGMTNRGAKDGSALRVLKDCTSIPAALVETAFMDAPVTASDINALKNRRADVAQAIADAIMTSIPLP